MLNHVYPFPVSGDQEYFTSAGPIIVSNPYPSAYPEYFGSAIQSKESKRLFSILA